MPDRKQRILTVHHLDGNKGNCEWWNIPPLCQVCHLQIQARVIMGQTWPFEHTAWMKPYVAGFYSWTILRENLTREEVDKFSELIFEDAKGVIGENNAKFMSNVIKKFKTFGI